MSIHPLHAYIKLNEINVTFEAQVIDETVK